MRFSSATKMTPEAFYQQLAQVGGVDLVAFAQWVVDNAPAHGLSVTWGCAGPLLNFVHEKHRYSPFMFGQLDRSGALSQKQSAVLCRCRELRLPVEIIRVETDRKDRFTAFGKAGWLPSIASLCASMSMSNFSRTSVESRRGKQQDKMSETGVHHA